MFHPRDNTDDRDHHSTASNNPREELHPSAVRSFRDTHLTSITLHMEGFAHRNDSHCFIGILFQSREISNDGESSETHFFWTDRIGTLITPRSVSPMDREVWNVPFSLSLPGLHVVIMQTEEILVLVGDEGHSIQAQRTFGTLETRQMIRLTQSL